MDTNTTVKMTATGQVSIPSSVRESLHWQGAMELSIQVTQSGLLIQSHPPQGGKRRLEDLRGLLKHQDEPLTDAQLHASVDSVDNS